MLLINHVYEGRYLADLNKSSELNKLSYCFYTNLFLYVYVQICYKIVVKQVSSMARNCHNHISQINQWHRNEETSEHRQRHTS